MKILSEFPVELAKHGYHSTFGKKEVRELMAKYSEPNLNRINPNEEYAVSFHNHSCDGKKQKIWHIAREAAEKGCKILAITDHNSDEEFYQQLGPHIVVPWYFKKQLHYVVRGMECNSMKNGKIKDMMFIGYQGSIPSRLPLEEAIDRAHKQGALVGITSPLNEPFFGLNEDEIENLLKNKKIDYMEILNSSKGAPFFHNDVIASLGLKEYNASMPKHHKVAGIYVSDSHVKANVMDAYFGIKKDDFRFLEDPHNQIKEHPEILIEGLRTAFRNNRVSNYGSYKGLVDLIFDKDTLESFFNQTLSTWNDYFHLRFSKHRVRNH
jgi:hypothetical protein